METADDITKKNPPSTTQSAMIGLMDVVWNMYQNEKVKITFYYKVLFQRSLQWVEQKSNNVEKVSWSCLIQGNLKMGMHPELQFTEQEAKCLERQPEIWQKPELAKLM